MRIAEIKDEEIGKACSTHEKAVNTKLDRKT
jgi:hypothetical protein